MFIPRHFNQWYLLKKLSIDDFRKFCKLPTAHLQTIMLHGIQMSLSIKRQIMWSLTESWNPVFMNQSRRRGNTCISLTCSTPISEYEQTDDRTEMAQWCLKPNINQNLGPCTRPRILHSNLLHVIKKIWYIKLQEFFLNYTKKM